MLSKAIMITALASGGIILFLFLVGAVRYYMDVRQTRKRCGAWRAKK